MPFTKAATKQAALDRICDAIGIKRQSVGPGSTEPTEPLREACLWLGLSSNGPKPVLAERIVENAGLVWDKTCDSRATASGGGGTVTLVGLNRVLEALEKRASKTQGLPGGSPLGEVYRKANENTVVERDDQILIDLSELDQSTRLHATTQNRAADLVLRSGLNPISPGPNDPQFDLAWRCSSGLVVAEVKTVQPANHAQQVRLGLGQVLEYRHRLSVQTTEPVLAVLILSSPPDPLLRDVCGAVGVIATDVDSMGLALGRLLLR